MSNLEQCNVTRRESGRCKCDAVRWYSYHFNREAGVYGRCANHLIDEDAVLIVGHLKTHNTLEDAVVCTTMICL
jgi:hypothetical protein